jgi:hypothetical protein
MTAQNGSEGTPPREAWEDEVFHEHRWGAHGEKASEEHARLRKLWDAAQPFPTDYRNALDDIIALEICNWNLEESILELCSAIGEKRPTGIPIGHMGSVSPERWRRVWAYYLALRAWLPSEGRAAYAPLLGMCDPDKAVQNHVASLLGDRTQLKELYAERFCRCLEFWLGGFFPRNSAQAKAHNAAVSAVEEVIRKRDPEGQILNAMRGEGDGRLQPCSHKAFRRYDIILSSIGAGKWRAVMPMRGTDGFDRAAILEEYLSPIEEWIEGRSAGDAGGVPKDIRVRLGERDTAKVFLASLLVSLLRSEQLVARQLAQSRSYGTLAG